MSGRPTARQVARWADEVVALGDRIGRHFARSEPRRRAAGYIRGLLSETERKNGWQLAEHLGDPTRDGVDAPTPAVARWVLIRRDVADPADVAFFTCGGPPGTTLADLVRVAGSRWSIEGCFEIGKGDCGLDHYEVRSWVGWHRHVTLSLFALAVVAVIQSRVAAGPKKKRSRG